MIGKRLGEVKNLMVKNHSASSRLNCWDKISFFGNVFLCEIKTPL